MSGLLDGPRARGAFLLRCVFDPPWSLRIQDEAPLTLVAVVRGTLWLVPDGRGPTRLGPGDQAIVRGPRPYLVADDPTAAPQVVIHPGQRCTRADGSELPESMQLGVRTWGNAPDGGTLILTGTYQHPGEISRRLVEALPELVVLRPDMWESHLTELLRRESERDEPGQDAVLDRLLDLLLITALRAWFSRPEADAPAWYRAHGDPVIGRALRLLQNNPAHPWTLAGLAAENNLSRAAFARRFKELTGQTPIGYLTGWRLTLAADLLREPDLTIAQIAERVGYASPFALSAAFKRLHGVSPHQYRHSRPADQPSPPTGVPRSRPAGDGVRSRQSMAATAISHRHQPT
jgi:AraC-like DNA-binding protein